LFGGLELVRALVRGDGLVGLVGAAVAGVVFGVAMGCFFRRASRDLAHLPQQDRAVIRRAVRRGEAPGDPVLAMATIQLAQRAQEQSRQRWPWVVLGGFAGLACLIAVIAVITGTAALGDVLLPAFWLCFLPLLRGMSVRATRRAADAELASRRMAGGPGAED
jgi:hypothetical protein